MTEAEWLRCTDPIPMLAFVEDRVSERKLRLFACACLRRVWHLLAEGSRKGVEFLEGVADRSQAGGWEAVADAVSQAVHDLADRYEARQSHDRPDGLGELSRELSVLRAADAARIALFKAPRAAVFIVAHRTAVAARVEQEVVTQEPEYLASFQEEVKEQQVCLLRDLIGNPFRPVTLEPGWLTWNDATVVKLAEAIYQERAFDRLPILADALEDAGCANADLLGHCRQPGLHVRGCWGVDLILGLK